MSTASRPLFDAQELVIAGAAAVLAQLVFVATFQLPPPKLVQADISNANGQPIAVAITPVLKLGSKNPTTVPKQWQRKPPTPAPAAAKTEPAPLPSPLADKNPQTLPTTRPPDASAAPIPTTSSSVASPPGPAVASDDAGSAVATASSVQGSEQGAANGTETDPLKGRAADMYRAQLASFFAARFQIKGKVPFETLKALRAAAVVTVTADRKVGSFTVVKPSGDPTFDAEVQATLARVQSSGAELPAPPPLYPDLLGQSLPVGFQCNVQRLCE